jgi:hypothetical protein
MVILMSPSPADVANDEPAGPREPAARHAPGDVDPALGPFAVERLLFPYPIAMTPDLLPEPAEPRREPLRVLQGGVDPVLGPFEVERLLFPYPTTLTPGRLQELTLWPAKPQRFPSRILQGGVDPVLGPFPVERLLFPYPATVTPDRLPGFAGWLAQPQRPAASAAEARPALVRLSQRMLGIGRRVLARIDRGTRAVRQALEELNGGPLQQPQADAAAHDRRAAVVLAGPDAIRRGLKRLVAAVRAFDGAPAPAAADRPDNLLPAADDAELVPSEPLVLRESWSLTDLVSPAETWAVSPATTPSPPAQRSTSIARVFLRSTGIAFIAAFALIPFSRWWAAGSAGGHARDSPLRD